MTLIGSLPELYLRGKKVLVAEDGFPLLHFLLTGIAERHGFTLQTVSLRQGAHWVEGDDIIAEWDEQVGLALLTWIRSTSSHKSDIDRLAAHGRQMGSQILRLSPGAITTCAGVERMLQDLEEILGQ